MKKFIQIQARNACFTIHIRTKRKTVLEIKLYRRVKKADPQAVQRGRLFRAALFAVFLVGLVCYGVRLYRRAKRADLYNTSARRSAILVLS